MSEAQLRDVFALEIALNSNEFKIFTEFPAYLNVASDKIHLDLLIKNETKDQCYAFEFKYKTKKATLDLFGETIELSDQEDTTNGRYEV